MTPSSWDNRAMQNASRCYIEYIHKYWWILSISIVLYHLGSHTFELLLKEFLTQRMLKNIPIWSHCLQRTRPFRQTIFYRIVLIRSLKNGPTPAPFLIYFWSFSNKQYNFKTNQCEKISCPSRIQRSDSNPQPFKHESSPKTTSLCPVFSLSKQNKKICHIFVISLILNIMIINYVSY